MASVLPVEELLAKVSEEAPCGVPDDATLAQIAALDAAVKRTAETGEFHSLLQAGEGLFRGGEVTDLGSREGGVKVRVAPVKHLKVAMVLTMAGLEAEGFAGFGDGLSLIEGLLTQYWEQVHPPGDPDDAEDPFISRVNILTPLAFPDPTKELAMSGPIVGSDSWRIEERLFKAALLRSDRYGPISFRDCLSPWVAGLKIKIPTGEDRTSEFIHEVLLNAAGPGLDAQRDTLRKAVASVEAIDNAFKQAPGGIKPNLDYLARLLRAASDILEDKMSGTVAETSDGPVAAKVPHTNGSGPVASREDAVRKLMEVAEYYRRNEPASPIPLLLDRARKLAGMNFHDLLVELKLGDQAAPEFRKLVGLPDPPPPESTPA